MSELTTITSQAQYERYKAMRTSYVGSHLTPNILIYNTLTMLIVEWDIKNDPEIKRSGKSAATPIAQHKKPIERASKRMNK